MLCSHLQSLLKKNLLIAKSTFILTTIELLTPIIIIFALLGLKSLFIKENLSFETDNDYIDSNSSLLISDYYDKFKNEKVDIEQPIYINPLYKCYDRNIIAFVGKNFPKKLANIFILKGMKVRDIKFKYYDDYKKLSDYIESKEYGINGDKICFAISCQKIGNKYIYKLHYHSSPYRNDDPPEIPKTHMGIGNKLSSQPDYKSYKKYTSSGFFMIQLLFYNYVLKE